MSIRTEPDPVKVFSAIAMIVSHRENAKVKMVGVKRKDPEKERQSA